MIGVAVWSLGEALVAVRTAEAAQEPAATVTRA